jgi:hypothetical protein
VEALDAARTRATRSQSPYTSRVSRWEEAATDRDGCGARGRKEEARRARRPWPRSLKAHRTQQGAEQRSGTVELHKQSRSGRGSCVAASKRFRLRGPDYGSLVLRGRGALGWLFVGWGGVGWRHDQDEEDAICNVAGT